MCGDAVMSAVPVRSAVRSQGERTADDLRKRIAPTEFLQIARTAAMAAKRSSTTGINCSISAACSTKLAHSLGDDSTSLPPLFATALAPSTNIRIAIEVRKFYLGQVNHNGPFGASYLFEPSIDSRDPGAIEPTAKHDVRDAAFQFLNVHFHGFVLEGPHETIIPT